AQEHLETKVSRDWFPIAMMTAIKGSSQVMPVDNGIKLVMTEDKETESLLAVGELKYQWSGYGVGEQHLLGVLCSWPTWFLVLCQVMKSQRTSSCERRKVVYLKTTCPSFRRLKESITYPGAVLGKAPCQSSSCSRILIYRVSTLFETI
ncbi:Hypothetical predicted protein, partial [Marmota monax]